MPYRADRDELEQRRADLRADLDAAETRAAALEGARARAERLADELADVERRLAKYPPKRGFPLLDDARVASPCSADWEAMKGDEQVRHCGKCEQNVYNLSAMTAADAEKLLRERVGPMCIRLYRRADGTVLTADCPVGLRRKRAKRSVAAVAGSGILAAAGAFVMREPQVYAGGWADARAMGSVAVTPPARVDLAESTSTTHAFVMTGAMPLPASELSDRRSSAPKKPGSPRKPSPEPPRRP